MSEPNENFLTDLALQYKIAQNLPVSEHLKILKQLEKLESSKQCLLLNYFLTIETNNEILLYFVKLLSKNYNTLTLDIISDMLLTLEKSENSTIINLKCEIANLLGRSKNSDYVLPLLYILNNKDEHYKLRLSCAEALGRIGSSYAVTPLIDIVNDNEEKSVYLRESAAKALGMLGDMRAVEPLANILENKNGLFDKFTFFKERIIETLGLLGQYGDDKSIKALKNALQDDAPCVRISAIEALSEIEDDRVIPVIESALNDDNEEVARNAVFSLYEICGVDYIKGLLENENLQKCCKEEIQEILNDISGETEG